METLGERLASERRKQGKSVLDVEQATNIRAGLIEALEAGEYERLPSSAYVRGYIQSYAKYLELPPEPLLRAYEDETGRGHAPSPVGELPANQVVPRREQAHGLQMRTAVTIAAVIAVLALVTWGIASALSGSEDETPPVPSTTGTETTESAVPQTTPPGDETTSAPSGEDETSGTGAEEPEQPEPFTLTITIDEGAASWMVVTVDGEREHVGTLDGGEKLTYEVAEEAVVSQIGKPGSVTITKDGEDVEIPPSADVPSVTITAE